MPFMCQISSIILLWFGAASAGGANVEIINAEIVKADLLSVTLPFLAEAAVCHISLLRCSKAFNTIVTLLSF